MLQCGGFIRARRERRADGSERIFYAPGLVTLAALAEFVEHYHLERHHQGLDNQLITPPPLAPTPANDNSPVVRRARLGGLLNYYHRRAA